MIQYAVSRVASLKHPLSNLAAAVTPAQLHMYSAYCLPETPAVRLGYPIPTMATRYAGTSNSPRHLRSRSCTLLSASQTCICPSLPLSLYLIRSPILSRANKFLYSLESFFSYHGCLPRPTNLPIQPRPVRLPPACKYQMPIFFPVPNSQFFSRRVASRCLFETCPRFPLVTLSLHRLIGCLAA